MSNVDINALAGGALAERISIELQRVAANISDPNTKATAARSLTIIISLKPDEEREIAHSVIDVKAKLAPAKGIPSRFIIDQDNNGKSVIAELKSGAKNQMMMDNDGDLADDRGTKVSGEKAPDKKNVVAFK